MLHTNAVEIESLFLIEELMQEPLLNNFMLVGETALSLYKGHRITDDIDLFTDKKFNIEEVKHLIKTKYNRGDLSINELSIGLSIYYTDSNKNHEVKIDIISFSTDPFLKIPEVINGIRISSLEDISAMKFNAIKTRQTKKDFIDIHFLLKDFSFEEMIHHNQTRFLYEDTKDCFIGISKINNADSDPMPKMLIPVSWELVKDNIKKEAVKYYNKHISKMC